MKTPGLKNPELNSKMLKDGFLLIPGFLNSVVVDKMVCLFKGWYNDFPTDHLGFWNTILNLPDEEFERSSSLLVEFLEPFVKANFINYEFVQATILSKLVGDKTNCPIHRDNSILDERNYMFWNCWIPLIDISEINGQLYVIKGSHKLNNGIVPFGESWKMQESEGKYILDRVKLFPKKGDLVLYTDRTLHGSFPNLSKTLRPVCHFGLLPKEPKFHFYQRENEGKITAYEVKRDFYLKRNGLKSTEEFLKDYAYDILEEKGLQKSRKDFYS